MISHNINVSEPCASCSKPIRAGHPFIVCQKCSIILHKKCKTTENIIIFRDQTFCAACIEHHDIIHYNPFHQAPHFATNDFLDDEPIDYVESIDTISNILENCKTYSIKELNSGILPRNQKDMLSTLFFNIDGNSTNFDSFLVQMSSFKHKFSVIGLAETNTDQENGNLYQMGDYSSCYQSRFICKSTKQIKGKGTGVCLYIHNSMNFSKINNLSICKEGIESLFVTITNLEEPIIAGVIYRPPNSNPHDFNLEYDKILSELNGKKAYILGDFNINLLNISSTHEEQLEQTIFSRGFTPTISIPTHQMPHCSRTCIDNIHTNDIDSTIVSGVISDKISHHHPIFLIKKLAIGLDAGQNNPPEKLTIHYDYSNSNLDKLCEEIENDIDRLHHSCDSFESFLTIFHEKIEISCKLVTPKTTKRNSITNPWITQGLINSIEKKARLYFEWRKTCSLDNPDGDSNKHWHYKEYKKFLKQAIKTSKSTNYVNKFEKCGNNSKKTWNLINELRGKAKGKVKDDFVIDGSRVTSRRIIADKFNKYFTSLATNLNEQVLANDRLLVQPIHSFVQYMSKSVSNSIYLEDTNPAEVIEIIMGFENGKASDIPISVLKRTANLISFTLSNLYNKCMQSGTFPSPFKIGKVTPIYKKDNTECIENYRPVSILPLFGKIFEKIIYKRLYTFFTSKGILHEEQFGFRKGHSTTHALHKSVDSISKSLASGKHVLGIFIDLSKAFDTLDHQTLLSKLENYGIRGVALSLLKSYLTERSQYVSFNNTTSDTLGIRYGVPQDSILGPLLFLLYMNDIINCCRGSDCSFVLYADDTNIFITGPSKEATFERANKVLELVTKFMKCNLLHINMTKCCYMHFKPNYEFDETCARTRPYADQDDKSRAIYINGNKIAKVNNTKYLGVVIDDQLSWAPHVKYLMKKLQSIIGALCRLRHSIPADLYRKIYCALFESHLSYGITVWGVALKDQPNDKLFITQKHCIRILFGDLDAYFNKLSTCARARPYGLQKLGSNFYEKEHTKPIFNSLKILTVQNLFKYHCISEIFKIIKFRCPYSLYDSIQVSKRDTSLTIILSEKSNTFLYVASRLWNTIHKRIVRTDDGLKTTVSLVKGRCKTIILEAQSAELKHIWTPNNFKISPLPLSTHSQPLHSQPDDDINEIYVA